MAETAMPASLAFRAGDRQLALALGDISEVLRVPRLTRVPNAPAALAGLANIRGEAVPVVSLPVALGDDEDRSDRSRLVLVRGPESVAVLVDEVIRLIPCGGDGQPLSPLDLNAILAGFPKPEARVSTRGKARDAARPETPEERHAFLAFMVSGQEFALPLDSVISVQALPPDVAEVPRTDDAMLGMIPWRERLLPLVSLRILLDLSGSGEVERQRVVICRIGGASVGLVVDSISTIIRAPASGIDPVPAVLTRGNAEAEIAGVCRLDDGRRLISILATDRLLRDGLADRLVEEEDRVNDSASPSEAATAGSQFLVFRLGDEQFGLPIECVEEVVRPPSKLTRLPRAPAFIEGVMNLRSRVIPVIDQSKRFNAGSGGEASKSRVVVVRIGDNEAGFRVDSVADVLRVRPDQIVETPGLASHDDGVIDRVAMLGDRMVLLVHPQEILNRAERDMLAAMARPENVNAGDA